MAGTYSVPLSNELFSGASGYAPSKCPLKIFEHCQGRECAESTRILLQTGCSFGISEICTTLKDLSNACRELVFSHIKSLQQTDHNNTLHNLDEDVFTNIREIYTAQVALELGFGLRILQCAPTYSLQQMFEEFDRGYCFWLAEHVDLLGRIYSFEAADGFHLSSLAQIVMNSYGGEVSLLTYPTERILIQISRITKDCKILLSTNSCTCGCAKSGCPALVAYLHHVLKRPEISLQELPMHLLALRFGAWLNYISFPAAPSREVALVVLRYLTFTALDIKHTCCGADDVYIGMHNPRYDVDEIREMHGGEEFPLRLLDVLAEDLRKHSSQGQY